MQYLDHNIVLITVPLSSKDLAAICDILLHFTDEAT